MKNKKIKVTGILMLSLLILFFGYKIFQKQNTNLTINVPLPNLPLNKGEEKGGGKLIETTLQINGVSYKDETTGSGSVYDFMSKLQNEGKINFTEKYYIGMGEMIVSINGIKNDSNQSWIYYVNDKEASVGVSNYKINPGDVVSWKYEKSNY
jgi:hypothetical protein